jgi:hypothetical protein
MHQDTFKGMATPLVRNYTVITAAFEAFYGYKKHCVE